MKIYLQRKGQWHGPYDAGQIRDELEADRILKTDRFWVEDWSSPKVLSAVPGFEDFELSRTRTRIVEPTRHSRMGDPNWKPSPLREEDALIFFVGERFPYYSSAWWKLTEFGQRSWNWAAFFGGASWLAYRKMYRASCLFLSGLGGVAIVVALIDRDVTICCAGVIASMLVNGWFANEWYLAHSRREIGTLIAKPKIIEDILRDVQTAGGTSRTASAVVSLGLALLIVLIVCLLRSSGS